MLAKAQGPRTWPLVRRAGKPHLLKRQSGSTLDGPDPPGAVVYLIRRILNSRAFRDSAHPLKDADRPFQAATTLAASPQAAPRRQNPRR
jgi:hypothetical protein